MENRPKTGRNAELKPCLNCAERYIGCHGRNEDGSYRCGKYAEVEAARAEERVKLAAYRREKEIDRYQRHKINEVNRLRVWRDAACAGHAVCSAYDRGALTMSQTPAAVRIEHDLLGDLAVPADCRNYRHRSVFVEWRDYQDSYGHEEVHY